MKKKLSKVLALACASILALTAVTGCSSNGTTSGSSTTGDSSTTSTSESSTSTDSKDMPTLTWWLCGGTPGNLAEGLEAINAYTAEKIGVKIDIKLADWGAYDEKMNTIINGGDYFDIMFVNNTNYNRFVNQEKFLDITELVKTEAPDLYSLIPELVWQGTYIGGKSYAVPTYKDSSITQYYVWDKAFVDKYNIDYENIKTLQQLDAPLRAMKEGEGNSYYPLQIIKNDAFNGFFNDYDDLTLGLQPVGVLNTDESRKVVSVLEQDDIMENLKLMHQWFNDGIINQDAPTLGEAPKGRPFFSAQAFPGADASWEVNDGIEDYVMTQVYGPKYSTSSIQGSLNAISAASKYPNEALKFLQLVNTDSKLRNMLAYGVPETDWKETDEENVIERTTDTWSLAAYQQGTFFNMAAVAPNKGDQYDAVKALNESADASTTLGYALDISNLSTEVANCNAIWAKYKYDLTTGASDPEEMVPQIVKELNENGMDKIIAEAQKQIDAYFAK